jgi:hypothetical protein
MPPRLGFFGGQAQGRITMENGHSEDAWFDCDLWFDRDIDGRWIVCVPVSNASDDQGIGAIVVRDETVGAFIELLGKLIAEPEKFVDEPVLLGPVWKPTQN